MAGPGEVRLRQAIRILRKTQPPLEPIDIKPTNALEAILIERIQHLEEQVLILNNRINWLIGLIVSALVAIVVKYVLG